VAAFDEDNTDFSLFKIRALDLFIMYSKYNKEIIQNTFIITFIKLNTV
jgi:hypothetical protein